MEQRLQELNSEKIQEYAPAIAYVSVVTTLGVLGNAFSVAFYGFNCPRTPTNLIITSLGTVDLVCCIVFNDEIIELCFTLTFKSVVGCKVMYFVHHILVLIGGTNLFFVAIDRYRKICQPFGWQFDVKRILIVISCMVVCSVLISSAELVIMNVSRVNVTKNTLESPIEAFYCTQTHDKNLQWVVIFLHSFDLFAFVVIVGGSTVLYTLIARKLLLSRNRSHRRVGIEHSSSVTMQNEMSSTCIDYSSTIGFKAESQTFAIPKDNDSENSDVKDKEKSTKADRNRQYNLTSDDNEMSKAFDSEAGKPENVANSEQFERRLRNHSFEEDVEFQETPCIYSSNFYDESTNNPEETDIKEFDSTSSASIEMTPSEKTVTSADGPGYVADPPNASNIDHVQTSTLTRVKRSEEISSTKAETDLFHSCKQIIIATDTVNNGIKMSSKSCLNTPQLKRFIDKKRVRFDLKRLLQTAERRVEKRVTLMMLVITIVSVISFVPYFVVNLGIRRNTGTSEQELSVGVQIALRSFMLNNAVNPYIIGIFNSSFRQFVKRVFKRSFHLFGKTCST